MHGLKCCLQTEQTQTDTTCYFCAFLRVLHNLDLLGFCIKIRRPSNPSFFLNLTHLYLSFFFSNLTYTFKTNIYQHSNHCRIFQSFLYPTHTSSYASFFYFFSLKSSRRTHLQGIYISMLYIGRDLTISVMDCVKIY